MDKLEIVGQATPLELCTQCGMLCKPSEYHPFAACLMFMAVKNSEVVRANLQAVVDYGMGDGDTSGEKL